MSNDKENDLILKAAEKLKSKKKNQSSTVPQEKKLIQNENKTLVEKASLQLNKSNNAPKDEQENNTRTIKSQKIPPISKAKTSTKKTDDSKVFINLPALTSRGIIDPSGERTLLAEEYRLIKRPLLLKAFAAPKQSIIKPSANQKLNNLIVVTSSEENEGKSFTAVNLAMSMASERDLHVLLIDCDMHANRQSDSIMSALGVNVKRGFLDVLVDESIDVSEVMLSTNIKNLSLLPVGNMKNVATELFASKRMAEKIKEIAQRYSDRVIIIDTPPVLLTSETSVIAMYAGQIVYVVEADRTSKASVEEGVSRVSFCPSVNIVLNKVKQSFGDVYHLHKYQESKYYSYDQENL